MADFGEYFEYNGKSSKDFGLIIVGFDQRDIPMGLTRNIIKGNTNQYRVRANHTGTNYTDVLVFEISVMKDICGRDDEFEFTRSELRRINTWLTEPTVPALFHMFDYPDSVEADDYVDYFGLITDVKAEIIGGLAGLTFTFTCDCPFGYSREINRSYTIGSDSYLPNYGEMDNEFFGESDIEGTTVADLEKLFVDEIEERVISEDGYHPIQGGRFSFENNSDNTDGFIYPLITIFPSDADPIIIESISDRNSITFTPLAAHNRIYIDCRRLTISSSIGGDGLINLRDIDISDPENIYWPRLIPGTNEFRVSGNCIIQFTYREYKKVGAY